VETGPDRALPAGGLQTGDDPRVVAVIVAHDRRDMLGECLDGVLAQTAPVAAILVVDNASTDGSAALARNHPAAPTVLRLGRNTGGAGGFSIGIRHAVAAMGAQSVWLLDDDTLPSAATLAALLQARRRHPGPVDLVCSRVVWNDGRDHPLNTPRQRAWAGALARSAAATAGAIPIRSASFVSTLITAGAIRRVGLPVADYFLWNDDFEYTARILRRGAGLLVRTSVVTHRTAAFGYADPGERFYYETRNKIWLFTRSDALGPVERLGYLGATLARWVGLVVRSPRRRVLLRAAARGLRDGVRRGPRDTAVVLAEATQDRPAPTGGAGRTSPDG
jgi:GT2 family glycosyltransferase